MTPDPAALPELLRQTAAEWYTRSLSARFGPQDRARLQAWLAEHPDHIRAYNQARLTWQALEGLKHDPELLALAPREGSMTPSRRRPWARWAAAASFAFVALGAAGIWQWQQLHRNVYATEPWAQRTITLADGSTARLSANTAVRDVTNEQGRGAVVERGEAIFDIRSDKQNPFIVTVADARIIVTGTRFQVRKDADRVAVTLVEGEIRLVRESVGFEQQVAPGQQVAFATRSPQAQVREVDVEAVTAWSRDRLVFRDAPLAEALREANRHATLKLVLNDPALADVRVNGHFKLGDTESLLAAVQGSFPVRAVRRDDQVLLTLNK